MICLPTGQPGRQTASDDDFQDERRSSDGDEVEGWLGRGRGQGDGTAKNAILAATHKLGQSIWYDNISRGAGPYRRACARSADQGVRGVTSNPTIFEKAIAGSSDYEDELQRLVADQQSTQAIYEELVLDDIRRGCDVMLPVFESSGGVDGRVSLEVLPELAADTEQTVAEGLRLAHLVGRPNVMIKVPATPEGIPAVRALTAQGVSVNVTLIFSLAQYQAVSDAYLARPRRPRGRGRQPRRAGVGRQLLRVARRRRLRQAARSTSSSAAPPTRSSSRRSWSGKIAIANAKLAYEMYQQTIAGARWKPLKAKGAKPQRLLWASTGTKDPRYPDTLYVDALIGPDTVNTVPPATLTAFMDHGKPAAGADARSRGGAPPDRGVRGAGAGPGRGVRAPARRRA